MDGILPFVSMCRRFDKGIFILIKTSNPSSTDIQDVVLQQGLRLYEYIAGLVSQWGQDCIGKYEYSSIGAVVGATYPEQARQIRKIAKHCYFLVPGYGAQGGTAKDIAPCFDENGLGAIINASRSIMCAYQSMEWKNTYREDEYAKAARQEAIRMKEDIHLALKG
jgi:orotidine-5'-phosphate decarboxylase